MARIRTIKPEFPQSESVGRLSRDARLLFIQLWTFVDDAGRARASSRLLASQLYPYDDDAASLMDDWLDELEAEGCIRRYQVNGSSYLDIPKWLEHQKIDRPSQSRMPAFVANSSVPREPSRALDADLGPRTEDQVSEAKASSPRRTASRSLEGFEEWYWAYPKHVEKKAAEKAYAKAAKEVPRDKLLDAARRYAVLVRGKGDTEFVKNPATWLNKGCWDDEEISVKPATDTQDRGHLIERGTRQWDAWLVHLRAEGRAVTWMEKKADGQVRMPSEWPPGVVKEAAE